MEAEDLGLGLTSELKRLMKAFKSMPNNKMRYKQVRKSSGTCLGCVFDYVSEGGLYGLVVGSMFILSVVIAVPLLKMRR